MRTISVLGLSAILCCSVAGGCGDDDVELEDTIDASGSSSSSSSSGSSGTRPPDASTPADASRDSGEADGDTGIASYTIGGTVTGLDGTGLVLQNNGGDDAAVERDGTFTFATAATDLSPYAVTVLTQPTAKAQTCVVSSPSGLVAGANVTSVAIVCTTGTYAVNGTISGLSAGETALVRNGSGDPLSLVANGPFVFPAEVAEGAPYDVTVTAPPGAACTITGGSGTMGTTPVTATIVCVPPPSCLAIKMAAPASVDGEYTIDPDGSGAFAPLRVSCDMTTDGGGYTSYAVNDGIETTRFDEANSCQAVGLQLVVARTNPHLQALYAKYGQSFFATVSGVYGTEENVDYGECAMSSSSACAADWRAIDGRAWFVRTSPFGEPNGDYEAGCWLQAGRVVAEGFEYLNDGACGYSTGAQYVCSDNAKDAPPPLP